MGKLKDGQAIPAIIYGSSSICNLQKYREIYPIVVFDCWIQNLNMVCMFILYTIIKRDQELLCSDWSRHECVQNIIETHFDEDVRMSRDESILPQNPPKWIEK